MNYKSHRVAGVCAGLIASSLITKGGVDTTSLITTGLIAANAAIGSAIPDIDHPNSHVGKNVKIVSSTINMVAGHRGIFHSPFLYILLYIFAKGLISIYIPNIFTDAMFKILIIMSCLSFLFARKTPLSFLMFFLGLYVVFIPGNINMHDLLNIIVNSFTIGIVSHLFLDMLTVSGIPLLYPISNKKYRLLKLKTNKHEMIARIIIVIPTIIYLFFIYYPKF